METSGSGTLYVVATPIGNLDDMTYRAVQILKSVDLIAAEDTRHSKRLLTHFGISTRLVSCHEHNEIQKAPEFIDRLKSGQNMAVISDAGTPCISDPGFFLVKAARKIQVPVIPIPGCSAAIAGLSASGLASDRFYFLGFLSKKKQQQTKQIQDISDIAATLIVYESPKRILKSLQNISRILGDRKGFLTREMTKRHETYIYGKLSEIFRTLEAQPSIKGEISLFIEGRVQQKNALDDQQLENLLRKRMRDSDTSTSGLARQVAHEFGISKKKVYDTILLLKSSD